jgi:hypothetical protein
MSEDDGLKAMGQVIQIDEARIRDHLGEMVRGTVEETLNALLDAEADRLCGAGRYERSQGRQDTRAGSYERSLHTLAGEVNLKVPKLRRQTFETAIIERYRRRESSVEEALIEMYPAGISGRRVEDITEALWGTRVSPSTVSNLNKEDLRQDRGLADPLGRADFETGDDEADVEAEHRRLNTGDRAPFAIPGLCLVARLGIAAQNRQVLDGASRADVVSDLVDFSGESLVPDRPNM